MSEKQFNNAVELNWDFWWKKDYMRILKSGVPLYVDDSAAVNNSWVRSHCSEPEIYNLPNVVSLLKSAPLLHKETASYALSRACESGDIDKVRELLNGGLADINNDYYSRGLTPLMVATDNNQVSVVSLLLTYKELVLDKTTREGYNALHFACDKGGTSSPMIPLLGSDKRCTPAVLNKKDNDGDTPLMWAVMIGNLECLKEMEKLQGTNFRTENRSGEGLLDVAWKGIRRKSRKEEHMSVLNYLIDRRKVESLKELAARAVACLLSCDTDVEKLDTPPILHPWVAGFMRSFPSMYNVKNGMTYDSDSSDSDEEEDMCISSEDMDEDQSLHKDTDDGVLEQEVLQVMEEEEDSDGEEMMMLMLLVNESLGMSPGQIGSATARATARIMKQAKDIIGREVVSTWNQCGRRTEVKGIENSKEMENIVNVVRSPGFDFLVEFDDDLVGEDERKVMALFGNSEEMEVLFGYSE